MTLRIFCFLLLVAVLQKDVSAAFLCCDCCDCSNNKQDEKIEYNIEIDYIDDDLIGQYASVRDSLQGSLRDNVVGLDFGPLNVSYDSKKDVSYNVSLFFDWFKKNRNNTILKIENIKFCDVNDIVCDAGGVRRQMYVDARDFLLSDPTLFKCEPVDVKRYYVFAEGKRGVDQEVAYEFLAYLLSLMVRYHNVDWSYTLLLELNPLIYKIILNQCRITDDLFTYHDLQYYAYGYYTNWNSLGSEDQKNVINDLKTDFTKILPQIKMFYNGICKFFNIGDFHLLHWFKKNEFLQLQEFFEGSAEITYEKFENAFEWINYSEASDEDLEGLKQIILEKIKGFSSEELRKFLIFVTGLDSFGSGRYICLILVDNLADDCGTLPFKASTCTTNLNINVGWMMDQDDPKVMFGKCLDDALKSPMLFSCA